MTEEPSKDEQAIDTDTDAAAGAEKVTPDELLSDFKGRPLSSMLAFTILAHVLVIGVFSAGFIKQEVFGKSTAKMDKAQRIKLAVQQSTTALREIAKKNHVDLQDLSSRFQTGADNSPNPAGTKPSEASTDGSATGSKAPEAASKAGAGTKPESAIEKKLKKKEKGPAVPSMGGLGSDDSFSSPNTP